MPLLLAVLIDDADVDFNYLTANQSLVRLWDNVSRIYTGTLKTTKEIEE